MCQYSGQCQNYPLPYIEDMFSSLAGDTVYSNPDITIILFTYSWNLNGGINNRNLLLHFTVPINSQCPASSHKNVHD